MTAPVQDRVGEATADPTAGLDVRDVTVELGGRIVLTGVDLHVGRDQLVGLIGPNGAGKTTLLRTVLGLVRPLRGQVTVDGRPTRPGRARIGYVPQRHDVSWDFPISVAGMAMTGLTGGLGLGRRPRAEHWEAVADALGRVRLTDLADRPVGQLSGGQRQRVLVARALASRPTSLLLDEPFTGLDVPSQELLQALFADLAHEGRAVLMTTHDLLGAMTVCDRIALLDRTVVACGTPAELAADPQAWMRTFGVGPDSTLLRVLSAVAT